MTHERVTFRLIRMGCCGHLLCWVNPRFPSFCPECGESIFPSVKQWVMQSDEEAVLEVHGKVTGETTDLERQER